MGHHKDGHYSPSPSVSGTKPSELHYTIECQSCRQKTKRDFKEGDYVMGATGTCEKHLGKKRVIPICGEKLSQH